MNGVYFVAIMHFSGHSVCGRLRLCTATANVVKNRLCVIANASNDDITLGLLFSTGILCLFSQMCRIRPRRMEIE